MAALPRRHTPALSGLSSRSAPASVALWETIALPALLAVCLALRTINLGALPIFFDEAAYTRAAQIVNRNRNERVLPLYIFQVDLQRAKIGHCELAGKNCLRTIDHRFINPAMQLLCLDAT